ncbi:MAG: hypothetical protein ACJATU_000098 [Rickettsiales bacterium]|jgi:hypothetical protein
MNPNNSGNNYLYHATSQIIGEGELKPHFDQFLDKNTIFLTNNLLQAYSYCVPRNNRITQNCTENSSHIIYYKIPDYKKGTIYQFDKDEKFEKLERNKTEFTCDTNLKIDHENKISVPNLGSLMESGVQIFYVPDLIEREIENEFGKESPIYKERRDLALATKMISAIGTAEFNKIEDYYSILGDLVKSGCLVYLNGERNKNPLLLKETYLAQDECIPKILSVDDQTSNLLKYLKEIFTTKSEMFRDQKSLGKKIETINKLELKLIELIKETPKPSLVDKVSSINLVGEQGLEKEKPH